MISLRGLRRKTRSVKSIQQITKAMKMVSSMKLKREREKLAGAGPYAGEMKSLILDVYADVKTELDDAEKYASVKRFFSNTSTGKRLVIVMASERGLCGSFNSNILRQAVEFIDSGDPSETLTVAVGRKAKDYFQFRNRKIASFFNGVKSASYETTRELSEYVMGLYSRGVVSEIYCVYGHFKSIIQQPVVIEKILPFELEIKDDPNARKSNFIYEPFKFDVFIKLVPFYVNTKIYSIMVDALTAEHSARMTAMESAAKNAQEVIDKLTLTTNKLRQEKITQELSEIVSNSI